MKPTRKSWLRLDLAHPSLLSEVRVRECISKTLERSVDVSDCVCTSVSRILNCRDFRSQFKINIVYIR